MKHPSYNQAASGLPGRQVESGSGLFRQLKESQDRLRMALECANIGVFDWDVANGKVIYLHPRTIAESGGLVEHEVEDAHWFATTHPDDIAHARERVDRAIHGETDGFSMRYRMRRSGSGESQWSIVHSRGRVWERAASGRAIRILGAYEDITSVVAREEHDRQRDEHLARTVRIASLSELATSLAHEINQPLATLTTYLQASVRAVRQKAMSNDELLSILQRSEKQTELVAEIVKRLKNLYRSGSAAEETVDLVSCVNEVLKLLRREIDEQHIRIQVNTRCKRAWVKGDRLQIEQVLYNLIRNAVDALQGQEGAGREILIGVIRFSKRYWISIHDNGPGIPAQIRPRLFEPFFTSKPKGTGLGLSISRTIIEAHRGRIEFDSANQQGTRFIIELPRASAPAP